MELIEELKIYTSPFVLRSCRRRWNDPFRAEIQTQIISTPLRF